MIIIETAVKIVVLVALILLISTTVTMLALGGLADIFQAPNLAISFRDSFLASFCLSAITGSYGSVVRTANR